MIKFAKLHEDAKIPNKKSEDAGYDLWACFDEDFIEIKPNESVLIHTGICTWFPKGYVMILKERSSTGKYGISIRSGVIDWSYSGDIGVCWTNCSNQTIYISKLPEEELYHKVHREPGSCTVYSYNKAIAQGVVVPVFDGKVVEVSPDEIHQKGSDRGTNGYGSTNKNER